MSRPLAPFSSWYMNVTAPLTDELAAGKKGLAHL